MRYPSRGPLTATFEPSPRDLAPPLFADGRVFTAPLDSDRLFCQDAATGRLLWEVDGIEIVHLLGVAHGRLFAATRTGILALDTATGQTEWTQPSEGRLPSLGRGLIAGSWLIWPTPDAKLPYRAVTLRTGRQQKDADDESVLPEPQEFDPTMLHTLPVGNLAFGQGCLAIAGLNELVVYVPAHRLKELPPAEVRPQARIDALYHQARRHASAGQDEAAAQTYRELLDATKSAPQARAWRELIESRSPNHDRERPANPGSAAKSEPTSPKPTFFFGGPALPLVQAWSQEDGRIWPADSDEFFVCTLAGQATCRSVADGSIRWKAALDFEPTRLLRWGDLVVMAGPDAVQALQVRNGRSAWTFAAPSRHWRLASARNGKPQLLTPTAGIVHAERWDDTLLVLDDHRRFYRLRLDTGEIVWQFASLAADIRPLDAAAFGPFVTPVEDRLWVQSVTGQPSWLDVKTTDPAKPIGARSRPWLQPPLVIGKQVIFAGEEGRIFAYYKAPPHERLWTYQAAYATSLRGELPRLVSKDFVLLAFIARNEGCECVRLDPVRGSVLWSVPARQLPAELDSGSVCIGDMAFFYVHAGKLHARSVNDGSLQWTKTLPTRSTHWQMDYSKHYLTVWPNFSPRPSEGDDFCVLFIDPWDGQLLQRLSFPGERGPGAVALTPSRTLVSVGGRIYGFRSLAGE
jgi:outer membrane protein assembly factor BamB